MTTKVSNLTLRCVYVLISRFPTLRIFHITINIAYLPKYP